MTVNSEPPNTVYFRILISQASQLKSLAEAATSFVDSLHRKFPGVKIKSIPAYEHIGFCNVGVKYQLL
jgi:hypothetical protein